MIIIRIITYFELSNRNRKRNSPVEVFAAAAASYLDITAEAILAHINTCTSRKLDMVSAQELIARRSSCFAVLNANA